MISEAQHFINRHFDGDGALGGAASKKAIVYMTYEDLDGSPEQVVRNKFGDAFDGGIEFADGSWVLRCSNAIDTAEGWFEEMLSSSGRQ